MSKTCDVNLRNDDEISNNMMKDVCIIAEEKKKLSTSNWILQKQIQEQKFFSKYERKHCY